jgi:isopenicillin N synthase-like dioxygenase
MIERRQSIAYFCNVNGDTIIEPLGGSANDSKHYPPITAKDHLMAKHLASMSQHHHHDEL